MITSHPAAAPVTRHPARLGSGLRRLGAGLVRGRPDDPRWARPALLVLLAATVGLYLWDLAASGWANAFYAAAAQAGSRSWTAYLFGSFDAANAITVDKPPASSWVMALSVRLFGLNAWSLLVPQALMGVATVGLVYATVRRRFAPAAGLLAGTSFALTPVAALMFRFDNPDALLVLLMTAATYATLRAAEDVSTAVNTSYFCEGTSLFRLRPRRPPSPEPLGPRAAEPPAEAVEDSSLVMIKLPVQSGDRTSKDAEN